MSNISISNLLPNDTEIISTLSGEEMESISGGNILIYGGPVVIGFVAGTAIRMGLERLWKLF
jgi:hypothetical protein